MRNECLFGAPASWRGREPAPFTSNAAHEQGQGVEQDRLTVQMTRSDPFTFMDVAAEVEWDWAKPW